MARIRWSSRLVRFLRLGIIRALTALIAGYRRFISPYTPPRCRFIPTCSSYALECIENRGLLKGGGRALWRLCRCHPLARGGYDPPPGRSPSGSTLGRQRFEGD